MKSLLSFFLLLLACAFSSNLAAATVKGGENVNVTEPVDGDLYIGANNVYLDAKVNGDLLVGARMIYVRDSVREDAMLAGQSIYLEAPIGDDARLAGAQLYIKADIFGDLFVGAGSVEISPEVTIHGDLFVGGGEVFLRGRVLGAVDLSGGKLHLEGSTEGPTKLRGGEVIIDGEVKGPAQLAGEQLSLGENARFHQDVRYWRKDGEMDFGPTLAGGAKAIFDESLGAPMADFDWRSALGLGAVTIFIIQLLSAALIALLLTWAFRPFFERAAERIEENYAARFGYGMAYLIGTPILTILAFVLVISIPVGLFLLATYGLSIGLAFVIAALLGTYWWQAYQDADWTNGQILLRTLGIYVLLKLVSWIPFLGWLAGLLAVALAFGAILSELFRKERAPAEMETEEIA